jgi:hypothetical protein
LRIPLAATVPLVDAIAGVVQRPSGYEHPDRRRPEALLLRRLVQDEHRYARLFLFGARDERDRAVEQLREVRHEKIAELLRLEGARAS